MRSVASELTRPAVIGMSGAVASGKSTLALQLCEALWPLPGDVVNADGFLFPNEVLAARGLMGRKGFPETYDVHGMHRFVDQLRGNHPRVVAPRYSHESYDVVPGDEQVIVEARVVVLEGVSVLGAVASRCDVTVYVDADETDLERWFVDRFHALRAAARTDPRSFYARFADLPDALAEDLARHVWAETNLVNLREHVAPQRAVADVVLRKGPDHSIHAVELRARHRAGAPAAPRTTRPTEEETDDG